MYPRPRLSAEPLEAREVPAAFQTLPVLDFGNAATLPAEIEELWKQYSEIDTVFLNAGLQYASDIKQLELASARHIWVPHLNELEKKLAQ